MDHLIDCLWGSLAVILPLGPRPGEKPLSGEEDALWLGTSGRPAGRTIRAGKPQLLPSYLARNTGSFDSARLFGEQSDRYGGSKLQRMAHPRDMFASGNIHSRPYQRAHW